MIARASRYIAVVVSVALLGAGCVNDKDAVKPATTGATVQQTATEPCGDSTSTNPRPKCAAASSVDSGQSNPKP